MLLLHYVLWVGPSGCVVQGLVCCRSPAEIVGSNPTGSVDVCCEVVVVSVGVVSATSRSLIQRSPTDCGALLCVI